MRFATTHLLLSEIEVWVINLSRNVYCAHFHGSYGTVSDCLLSKLLCAGSWPYPKAEQRWKDTPHWGSQSNVPAISLDPNEGFVSVVSFI